MRSRRRVLAALLAVVFPLLLAACGSAEPIVDATPAPQGLESELDRTELVVYAPELPENGTAEDGECTAVAFTVNGRDDAWRCRVDGMFYDPCFETVEGHLACGMDPVLGDPGFAVQLTSPLPVRPPDAGEPQRYWRVELEHGAICVSAAGEANGVDEASDGLTVTYRCSDGGVLISDLAGNSLLVAQFVADEEALEDPDFDLDEASLVAAAQVWR